MERSIGGAFTTKIFCIFFIIFQLSNLVICGDTDDESLQNALEFVERRQRDLQLQDNDYYGQPENIGYGYQKNFGIFENGPARELGSPDSDPESENDFRNALYNYANYQRDNDYDGAYSKRKSGIRERYSSPEGLVSDRESENNGDIPYSYMQVLKDLWSKYRQSRADDVGLEDLSPEQVSDILNSLYEKEREDEGSSYTGYTGAYGTIPLRARRNYRVFDRLTNRRKRYPSFGEGFYGKRNVHAQHLGYENPPENEFLYALKFVNPEINREAVENLKEGGYEVLGDERDRDVMRILNDAAAESAIRPEPEEPYWVKTEEPYEKEIWLPGPVSYPSDDAYEEASGFAGDKRMGPKIFKPHNGIHLNTKRMPVKRNSVRAKKETTDEKVSKELESIFGTGSGEKEAAKKKKAAEAVKKQKEVVKKQNATKPEVTKHRDAKKLVRRANEYTKEEVYPSAVADKSEIEKIFSVKKSADKKSIDWSEYFGYDKRSEQWLRDENVKKAENYFLTPKSKRYYDGAGGYDRYEAPFDTRVFNNKKKLSYANVDRNIDRMERKLGTIEERIIDDAVKYTGAHTGDAREDMRKVKNEIVHHLEAAYSLEKMKNALEEFKNSMKAEKGFSGAEEQRKSGTESPKTEAHATTVRTESAKTEKPDADKNKRDSTRKEIEDVYGKDSLEFINWPTPKENAYQNNQDDREEACPVLDKSLNNCMKIDEISGRFSELLLPICSLQQICYICGSEIGFSRPSACDLMYLKEAENLCQGNKACLMSARDSILALRDLHEQDLLTGGTSHLVGSCLFNPCIQKYFMNTPAAVVPLEYQD